MSAPLPTALRTRFQRLIEEGLSGRAAALRLKVSPVTGARWGHQVRIKGHAEPARQGPPRGKGKLAPHQAFLEELVAQAPDITLFELRDALTDAEGVRVHHSSIANLLSRLGFKYKKNLLVATERRRAKVRQQRADWFRHRLPAIAGLPERVVFIDETAVKTNLTHLRGRAQRGERLTMDAPFWQLGHADADRGSDPGRADRAMGHQGAMDGPAFAAYIREILVPEIAPGTVVILDNLATHRNKEAAQALRDHGCWFLYLPPYSPDLNPIEQAYSKLKAHLRRIGARTFTEVFGAIGSLCDLYDPKECRICLRLMSKSFREALVGTTSVHASGAKFTSDLKSFLHARSA
ncbi:IS630 family transposase [Sedimentitalea nanhaiensis]|uniref:Transposase n=1 Tax=Sedimentitalea nanhaiensis TaxID=999627 RepID=A0A1I7E4Z5_9RHOB|nr:IS630 family transposase [Sedimentitalea nanhaiensis]SFU19018.1 Transposase [Sedimentitalea nanhaiensis]